jgi:ketosteroid isomerase-like protein
MVAIAMLVFAGSFVAAAQTSADKQAEQELLRITREMIDTSLRGDKSAFARYTADTYIETDINGAVATKTKILENFLTPPSSMKPTLEIQDVQVHVYGDTAVMSSRDVYRAEANGQKLTNSFRTTDVWLRRDGRWQLIASHDSQIPPERVAVKVDPKIYDAYAGEYEIAPGLVFTVTRDGDKLMGQSTGEKKLHELQPQNETTFFIKGDPDLNIFVKDEKGQVTHMIFRSLDGQEIKAKKIK